MKKFVAYLQERGLWDNIHAKRKRIANGSGEHMRKPGSKGAPTKQNFVDAQEGYWQDALKKAEADRKARKGKPFEKNPLSHDAQGVYKGDKDLAGNPVPPERKKVVEGVDLLDETMGANMDTRAVHQHLRRQGWKLTRTSGSHDVFTHPDAKHHISVPRHRQLKPPVVRTIVKQSQIDETAAWTRKEGKNPEGGLNRKGIASYRAENPGSKLSMAVTTKPSKLKPGSKAANRRKSFCARMSGVDGPMKKPNGKPTRKALALRKWNC